MHKGTLIVIAFLFFVCSAQAATIYVPDDYATIQEAINASVNGDTVIVRPGTYVENIDFIGKAITVKSGNGVDVTAIDGGNPVNPYFGSVVTFYNGEGASSVLEGFTITNGIGREECWSAGWWHRLGGGIFLTGASATIRNNIIEDNSASNEDSGYGGGIFCERGSPIIENNIIRDNYVSNNQYGYGGGIALLCASATIRNNVIIDNSVTNNGHLPGGGAVSSDGTSSTIVVNNTIVGNSAKVGGGILCHGSGSLIIANTILAGNSAQYGNEMFIHDNADVSISYSDVFGGLSSIFVTSSGILNWGNVMIVADPLFADSSSNDYHLTWDSPCKDTGDNAAVTELIDFEGDPRVAYGTVDMGADEFHPHLYYVGDVIPNSPTEVKVIGDPGTTPVTLALGSGIQDPPQSTPYGDLYLLLPPVRTFNLGAIPSNGILTYPGTVPPSWQSGDEYPFQALLGLLAPSSVLTNLMVLTVE